MQKTCTNDGAYFHQPGDPIGAIPGKFFLGELVSEGKPLITELELARLLPVFFDAPDETGFSKEKPEAGCALQLRAKRMIGVNGEVSGHEREFRPRDDVVLKKFPRPTAAIIIAEAGIADGRLVLREHRERGTVAA